MKTKHNRGNFPKGQEPQGLKFQTNSGQDITNQVMPYLSPLTQTKEGIREKAYKFLNARGLLSRTDEDFDNNLIQALIEFNQ